MCAVCILSVVLLYQNYVVIPRQNRELVEELKTCFPEDIPPGGGSPGEKEEQAGREPEVSAVDLRSLQRQYPGVRGSLILSMALRFVPRFTAQLKVIRSGQKAMGRDVSEGSLFAG